MKRIVLYILIALMIFPLGTVMQSYACSTGYGVPGNNQEVSIFDGTATLFVSDQFEFLDSASTEEYFGLQEVTGADPIFVSLFSLSEDKILWAFISHSRIGYINDDLTNTEIDKEALLLDIHESYDDSQMAVDEYYQEPYYYSASHRLTWCTKTRIDEEYDFYDYVEIILTREGYVTIEIQCSLEDLAMGAHKEIVNALTITNGYRYEDFDQNVDMVSPIDLQESLLSIPMESAKTGSIDIDRIISVLVRVFLCFVVVSGVTLFIPKRKAGKKVINKEFLSAEKSYYQQLKEEEERNAFKYYDD